MEGERGRIRPQRIEEDEEGEGERNGGEVPDDRSKDRGFGRLDENGERAEIICI